MSGRRIKLRTDKEDDTSVIDFMMIIALASMFMLALAVAQMRPPKEEAKGPDRKAEMLIQMTWPDTNLDDIDLWLLLPTRQVVSFRVREADNASLDRDDLGTVNDTYTDINGKQIVVRANHETIALRSLSPGQYVVNVQVFSARPAVHSGLENVPMLPYPVKVMLTQLNPTMKLLATNSVTVERVGQQMTALSFVVNDDGTVGRIDTEEQIPFIAIGGYR